MGQPHELAQVAAAGSTAAVEMFMARAVYDFAVNGGAIGTIDLLGATILPAGALIIGAQLKVITPAASGGAATIAIQCEGAGDIQAAAAYNGAPWSTAGDKAATKTFATAPIRTTVARSISAVIAAAALTAGKFEVIVYYLPVGL